MKSHVTDYALYRWRYKIGYSLIFLIVVVILGLTSIYIPGSLREAELSSALESGALSAQSLDPATVVNLPYHILQRLGFMVFGVSTLTIKLPSIILGTLTSVGICLLTRAWFRRNVAVLATVLAVTTTQFLFLIQDGTPAILFTFVTIWLLTAGTYVTRSAIFNTFWKVIGCVLMATALYVPLGVYVVIALLITASFHPHIRYIIRKISRPRLILALILGLASIAPLVYASIVNPSVALTLLGVPTASFDIVANLKTVALDLFGFFSTSTSALLRPTYSLGVVILMAVGIYKFFTVKYTARSYVVLILATFMLPLIILNPKYLSSLYPLSTLMIAMGMATMIASWYKLFPRHPYARVAGLLPLSIFVVGLIFSGMMRYMNNYSYNPQVLDHYSSDLALLDQYLAKNQTDAESTRLVASKDQLAFYSLVAHYDKRFSVSVDITDTPKTVLLTHDSRHIRVPNLELSHIVTSHKIRNADRFYVYTTKQ